MSDNKMHLDEVNIHVELVRQLLAEQFPNWAHLALEAIYPAGTDNRMYKLGDDKVVRLPRRERAAINIEKERLWLPQLAPLLPLTIPLPLGKGLPSVSYPLPWLVCSWQEGKNPTTENAFDYKQAAIDLGNFVASMQKMRLPGGPICNRGQPLRRRDQETREAIVLLKNTYDNVVITDIWESSLATPAWKGDLVWIHGDLHAGNILVQEGRVTGVIDFGSVGIGDPACDLMLAWTLLTAETRDNFRSIVGVDDAMWNRARGWALNFGIVAYPYYKERNPLFAEIAKRTIDEVLVDYTSYFQKK